MVMTSAEMTGMDYRTSAETSTTVNGDLTTWHRLSDVGGDIDDSRRTDLTTWHRLSHVGADINDSEHRLDDMTQTVGGDINNSRRTDLMTGTDSWTGSNFYSGSAATDFTFCPRVLYHYIVKLNCQLPF